MQCGPLLHVEVPLDIAVGVQEFLFDFDTREILLGKARFLSLQKRSDEVGAIYNTLLARDPLDSAALSGWADNLMAQGRNQEALAIFESVLSRPGATPGWFRSTPRQRSDRL